MPFDVEIFCSMIEYASIFCNNISASSTHLIENQNMTLDYFLGDAFSSSDITHTLTRNITRLTI